MQLSGGIDPSVNTERKELKQKKWSLETTNRPRSSLLCVLALSTELKRDGFTVGATNLLESWGQSLCIAAPLPLHLFCLCPHHQEKHVPTLPCQLGFIASLKPDGRATSFQNSFLINHLPVLASWLCIYFTYCFVIISWFYFSS